jgi:hypothetical protein
VSQQIPPVKWIYALKTNILKIKIQGLRERDDGGNVKTVKYNSDWNCHFESPLYNEYILIKNWNTKTTAKIKQNKTKQKTLNQKTIATIIMKVVD